MSESVTERLDHHQKDFKEGAWKQYTSEELSWWVKLLVKRAKHRQPGPKRDKDLYDAQSYLLMFIDHVNEDPSLCQQYQSLRILVLNG